MASPTGSRADPRSILTLARRDRAAASRALAALPEEELLALVCEAPAEARPQLLTLAPDLAKLVPALPEAELCYTVKAVGLHDAGWLLEHASPEQLNACMDLDLWPGDAPDRQGLARWFSALQDAGQDSLLRAALHLDPELLVLALRDRMEVWLQPNDDDWEPPPGSRTLDGQFHFRARAEKDDLADVEALLRALFERDYWRYFRLLQGAAWELESDLEEWALRWRKGRLADLGFPEWEEAMRIYGIVPRRSLAEIPAEEPAIGIREWRLPVWLPGLPAAAEQGPSLLRAMARLAEAERRGHFFAFVALANKVAVADRLPLGDAETIPAALRKAAETASRGLDHLAAENHMDATEVLRRVSLERIFRVGFSLARDGAGESG